MPGIVGTTNATETHFRRNVYNAMYSLKSMTTALLLGLTPIGALPRCYAQAAGTQPAPANAPQSNPPAVKPPPVPTGIVPLPQSVPPTGLQAPLPTPALPLPTGDKPVLTSPDIATLSAYLQQHPLTINDAVSIALATNRALATSVEALFRAQGRTLEARSLLNPTLGVSGNLTEFDAPTTANLAALSGGGSGGSASSGTGSSAAPAFLIVPQFNPVFTASVGLPLDIGGTLRAAASQAQFNEVAARIDINRIRNQVVLDVKNAFYNVLRARAQVDVATDNLNNTINRFNDAQKNYAAGTAPRFDVITATRDVSDAQQNLITAKSAVSVDIALLNNALGLNINTPLQITPTGAVDTPPDVAPPTLPSSAPSTSAGSSGTNAPNTIPPTPPNTQTANPVPAPTLRPDQAAPKDPSGKSFNALTPSNVVFDTLDLGPEYNAVLQEAQRNRPEVLEADAQIAAAQRGIQYARRSELPSFNLSVGYTYTPNAAGFTRQSEGAATLGFTVPILEGGLARARVRQARADVATAQTNRRGAVDQITLDVRQAFLTLIQARDRVAVANVGLTQAREAARLARVRYNAGVSQQTGISPLLELSSAQTSLALAEANQVNALYDYNNARAQLDRAAGRYSYVPNGPGYATPPPSRVTGSGK